MSWRDGDGKFAANAFLRKDWEIDWVCLKPHCAIVPLLTKLPKDTLVILVFDEGETGDQIYGALYGDMVKPGSQSSNLYNHYNILKLIEDNFALGNLGQNDVTATDITGIWTNGK